MTAGERVRGQLLRRTPTWALIGGLTAMGLWNGLRWLAAHLLVAAAVLLVALSWWAVDRGQWLLLVMATGGVCIGLGAVMELNPLWWRKVTAAAASRRRLRWYRKRWEPAMVGAGLTLADDVPQLLHHRFGGVLGERDTDVLTVRTVPGQVLEDWRHVAPRLAAAWGRTRVRVHATSGVAPRELTLVCSSRTFADRRSVAGAQVPLLRGNVQPASTAVEEPVDGPATPSGSSGAFPKQPRGGRP